MYIYANAKHFIFVDANVDGNVGVTNVDANVGVTNVGVDVDANVGVNVDANAGAMKNVDANVKIMEIRTYIFNFMRDKMAQKDFFGTLLSKSDFKGRITKGLRIAELDEIVEDCFQKFVKKGILIECFKCRYAIVSNQVEKLDTDISVRSDVATLQAASSFMFVFIKIRELSSECFSIESLRKRMTSERRHHVDKVDFSIYVKSGFLVEEDEFHYSKNTMENFESLMKYVQDLIMIPHKQSLVIDAGAVEEKQVMFEGHAVELALKQHMTMEPEAAVTTKKRLLGAIRHVAEEESNIIHLVETSRRSKVSKIGPVVDAFKSLPRKIINNISSDVKTYVEENYAPGEVRSLLKKFDSVNAKLERSAMLYSADEEDSWLDTETVCNEQLSNFLSFTLPKEDMQDIVGGKWLTSAPLDMVLAMLNLKYNMAMQNSTDELAFRGDSDNFYVQFHNANNMHWLVSCIHDRQVYVIDSSQRGRAWELIGVQSQLFDLYGVAGKDLHVTVLQSQQQTNGDDCGIYCIWAAIKAAKYGHQKKTPEDFVRAVSEMTVNQSSMRDHLVVALLNQTLPRFEKGSRTKYNFGKRVRYVVSASDTSAFKARLGEAKAKEREAVDIRLRARGFDEGPIVL